MRKTRTCEDIFCMEKIIFTRSIFFNASLQVNEKKTRKANALMHKDMQGEVKVMLPSSDPLSFAIQSFFKPKYFLK